MQENCELLRSSRERLKLRWAGAVLQARKYHPYAAEGAGQYLEELEGMAEGAGLPLDDLMVLNCIEGIAGDALHLKCTSFAVSAELTAEGHVLVGHNEDWWPEDQDTVYLVHATPENEPAYLAFTYGGLLPNIGFNAAGIAQCCDSVYPNDTRVGVPRIFVARSVLVPAGFPKRSSGPCLPSGRPATTISSQSAAESSTTWRPPPAFRTTLWTPVPSCTPITTWIRRCSAWRRTRKACSLPGALSPRRAAAGLAPAAQSGDLQTILADHVNQPRSICCHCSEQDSPLDRSQTIASVVMDLTALTMTVAVGNPCTTPYETFALEP
jgi:isopenicillin-N N-acyltransferase-like protein